MTNHNVVEYWIKSMNGAPSYYGRLEAARLRAEGEYLVSYNTPIAKYFNGTFQLISRKYSVTTSKHQNLVKKLVPVIAPTARLDIVEDIECGNRFPFKWSGY